VLDYLTDEVLVGQPAQVHTFLLETSVLERLSGELCDAVTGRTDSQAMLQDIERAGLFLVPLDERAQLGGAITSCSPACCAPGCRPNSPTGCRRLHRDAARLVRKT
jgi:hypothetical protein